MNQCARLVLLSTLGLAAPVAAAPPTPFGEARHWLAGDHHVHSIYSASYPIDPATPDKPPAPVIGGDSAHTVVQNAQKARSFGLDWMVATDHGGPGHSALNYARAWPDVVAARQAVQGLTLFYGAEFDVPGGEHATLMLPINDGERDAQREAFPADQARTTKARMIAALRAMAALPGVPVLIGNHPSRTATGFGRWGMHAPAEYLAWHAAAPRVAIGMEGAPGHQAARPKPGLDAAHGARGLYGGYPTHGGFDQMAATLGGAWDAMLGQGVHWTITASSDSHGHWREGGADFWPGEYAKTWVFAARNATDILDGLRAGRVFVATGGLIDRLDVTAARTTASSRRAAAGDTLKVAHGERMTVTIRFRPARTANASGAVPKVDHVDLIAGSVTNQPGDRNPTTHLVRRFGAEEWRREGDWYVVEHRMSVPAAAGYVRVRGTSTREGEPAVDTPGEDPWQDLWFYSNPVYFHE
jgi:hypothetical protein